MVKPTDEKKASPAAPTMDEKLFTFQSHLVNLFRYKQKDTKSPIDGTKLETDFKFEGIVDKCIKDKFSGVTQVFEEKKDTGGVAGLDKETKDELDAKVYNTQKEAYDTELKEIESKFTAQQDQILSAFKTQADKLLESNEHKHFLEVSGKDWQAAAKATTETKNALAATLKQIEDSRDKLKQAKKNADSAAIAEEAQKTKDEKEGKIIPQRTPEEVEKDKKNAEDQAKNREILLKNQLKKLSDLEKQITTTLDKLPEDVFNNINKTSLKSDITNPNDAASDIKAGTVEEMNKQLAQAQLKRLMGGKGRVWASVDPHGQGLPKYEDLDFSKMNDAKPGKYRAGKSLMNKEDSVLSQFFSTALFALTIPLSLYLYFSRSIFTIDKEGSVLWNSKDEFSPDFFTVFQARHPGKPMYLDLDSDVTEKYLEKMVKEARERRPILILKLSDACKKSLGDKADRYENILLHGVGDSRADPTRLEAVVGDADAEGKTHLHGSSKPPRSTI
jgi:hypothetical protein